MAEPNSNERIAYSPITLASFHYTRPAVRPKRFCQNSDASKCSLCKIVAIAVAVLLVAGISLGIAVGYLNERGPSVAAVQIKSPGSDGATSTLVH
jgi:hypothetical protein